MERTSPSLEDVLYKAVGSWTTGILNAATVHSIFTHIDNGARTSGAIAERAKIAPRGAQAVLDGLLGIGLVTREGDEYRNTAEAEAYLVRDKPGYMGDLVQFFADHMGEWSRLWQVVRDGVPSKAQGDDATGTDWEKVVLSIIPLSQPGAVASAARLDIANAGPISLLDVGGGSGIYSATWLEANPRARATQVDFAEINSIARRYVSSRAVGDRFSTADGSLHDVDFGNDEHDFAVYSHVAHGESPAGNLDAFRKLRTALKPGGTLVIADFILDDDRTAPPFVLMFQCNMLKANRQGGCWRKQDYRSWLDSAGFRDISTELLAPIPLTLIYAV